MRQETKHNQMNQPQTKFPLTMASRRLTQVKDRLSPRRRFPQPLEERRVKTPP